jgi:hypothetical protein
VVDDLVVHRAATQRVRVGDESGVECVRMASIEQSFETARGTAEVFDGLDVRAERSHRDEFTRREGISRS